MTHLIFHLTTPAQWQQAQAAGVYLADSLKTEGFIHASTLQQVMTVANAFYRSQPELILLCLDPDGLTAEIRWESPVHPSPGESNAIAETTVFPHIYGAVNLEAVQAAIALSKDGLWWTLCPTGLEKLDAAGQARDGGEVRYLPQK